MHIPNTAPPMLRDLLAEACEHRRRGDLAAATHLEMLAALALRAALAAMRQGGRA